MIIGPGALLRFLLLYAALYASFGVASPFLPGFLKARGLTSEHIGLLLAVGTLVRLLAGPVGGRVADFTHRPWLVFAFAALAAAVSALLYLPAQRFWALLLVSIGYAACLAPLAPLADALALAAANAPKPQGFQYGWVRGAGSAAFITGSLAAGRAIELLGINLVLWMQGALLALTTLIRVPEPPSPVAADTLDRPWIGALFRIRAFRRLLLVAALVLGSHAMHDAFAVIRWRSAGISPQIASLLWSESVAAEIIIFLLLGPALVVRIGVPWSLAASATAGIVRWSAMALSTKIPMLALVEPLHGATFALLHLAAMRLIGDLIPAELAATAQAVYGTVAVGAAVALMTAASGWLYGNLGAGGFWVMAALCVMALPLVSGTRYDTQSQATARRAN
jgi:MFS transporter, PPP family, 3-phenylpropionic acid transporter